MLRTPAFGIDGYHTLIQYIRQTILHWLKIFWKFSLFYGEYIANPPWQKIENKDIIEVSQPVLTTA
ncbi:MAG: hypothetical protein AAGJ08_08010 [Cyanobacteria bacterium P01_H01_bin.35]